MSTKEGLQSMMLDQMGFLGKKKEVLRVEKREKCWKLGELGCGRSCSEVYQAPSVLKLPK